MHRPINQQKRLVYRGLTLTRAERVDAGLAPGVVLAVDEGEPVKLDVERAVLVDVGNVARARDVEGGGADDGGIWDVYRARDEREGVGGDAGARLQVAPRVAVLVWLRGC